MSNIKLLALDLDGTLLDKEKRISDENIKAISEVRKKGVHVVFNTGRPLVSILEYLSLLEMYGENEYSITVNGGLVQRNDGLVLSKSPMSFAEVERVVKEAERFSLPCDIVSGDTCYTIEFSQPSLLTYVNNTLDFKKVSMEELPKDAEFSKIIISREVEELEKFLTVMDTGLKSSFEIFKTRDILLEIMPKNVNKASGLAQLCEHLGIKQEEVLAMGDEDNDAPMLAWAGLGIAPSNAKGEAVKSADEILEVSCNESAVAAAVKKYIL